MLATDGEETYVLFLYRDIQWGEGSVAGFNDGDGRRGFMLPGDVRTLESRSNVGPDFPGVWMFRVDQQQVLQPREGNSNRYEAIVILICFILKNM